MTLQSPGVFTQEDEIGTVIPNGGVGTAATVGRYNWGPAFEQMSISSPSVLLDTYKTPDRNHRYSYLSTEIISRASNDLRVVRAIDRETAQVSVPQRTITQRFDNWQAASTDTTDVGLDVGNVAELMDSEGIVVGYIGVTEVALGVVTNVAISMDDTYTGDGSDVTINWLNVVPTSEPTIDIFESRNIFGWDVDIVVPTSTSLEVGMYADLLSSNDTVIGNLIVVDTDGTGDYVRVAFNLDDYDVDEGAGVYTAEVVFPGTDIWEQQGNKLDSIAQLRSITALSNTDIAGITEDVLITYTFDGTDWSQVGNSLPYTGGYYGIAALSNTDVAVFDSTNDLLITYTFDGTDWSQVGNSSPITTTAGFPVSAIAALNNTDVAICVNKTLVTYTFDGTDWVQTGNVSPEVRGDFGGDILTSLNSTDVVFCNTDDDILKVYTFNGTDWTQVGQELILTGVTVYESLNNSDIAYIADDVLGMYRWDGNDWSQIGVGVSFDSSFGVVIAALNSNDIAIYNWFPFSGIATFSFDGTVTANYDVNRESGTVSTLDLFYANDSEVETALSSATLRETYNAESIPALFARYPGAYGDRITVDVVSFADFDTNVDLVDNVSGETVSVSFADIDTAPAKDGQYAIIVRDNDQVVLTTTVSTVAGDRNVFGQSIYINDLTDTGRLGLITGSADFGWGEASSGRYHMTGGTDGDVVAGMFNEAWDLLSDSSLVPAQVMSVGPTNGEAVSISSSVLSYARGIADSRGNTLITTGTPPALITGLNTSDSISTEVAYRTGQDSSGEQVVPNIAGNSKRVTYVSNLKWTYDRFNDTYFWMDAASDKAARIVEVLSNNIPWQSASGQIFGQLTGVSKLAYNPNKGQRDTLYKAGINPTVLNNGAYYFRGDKTLWPEPSAFSRENVTQLFNKMKTDISNRAALLEFQNNTQSRQRQYKNESDAYMRNLLARDGIEDFRNFVVELNTPEVRARNEFRARHAVKPVYSINFVVLQFTSVGPDVDFEELEG